MPLERLPLLVLPARGRSALVAPRLEAMAAARSPAVRSGQVSVTPWDETDDAHALVASLLAESLGAAGGGGGRGLVSDRPGGMPVPGPEGGRPGGRFRVG